MTKTARIQIAAAFAALLLVTGMVWRVSSAAFTGTTSNTANSWQAGTVTLTDSDNGAALFSASAWAPGDSANGCIDVTYTGSVKPASAVTISAQNIADSIGGPDADGNGSADGDGLSTDLDLVVEILTAGETCSSLTKTPTGVYSGTLAALATAKSTGWTPDPSSDGGLDADLARAFVITATLGSDTDNDAQGDGSTADFTWSATS